MLKFLFRVLLAAVLFSAGLVFYYRFENPALTAVMRYQAGKKLPEKINWCSWGRIAPAVKLAAVAAEDQKFFSHNGFDYDSISKALAVNALGGKIVGGSTISQQVAKNLFLWTDREWGRKLLEAYFTFIIEKTWSKQRILEMYLNIVQFGPGIYGIGNAARRIFGTEPAHLTVQQAAALAAVLPAPARYKAATPDSRLQRRISWIISQMKYLAVSGKCPGIDTAGLTPLLSRTDHRSASSASAP